jgi:gentisate 1,2-dioxygenase
MSASALDTKPPVTAERQEFYDRLGKKSATPLWEVLSDIVTVTPKPVGVPALWRYDELRPLLMEAGDLITAHEAERRVLILENPALPGRSQITGTLYAGLQLVLPGEVAPSHRHTPSALRFVLESEGGYTAVDGERITMHPGDFIVTPSWTYHDHGNDSNGPIIWMDVLDLPLINYLAVGFAEHHPQETQPVTQPEGASQARFGSGLFPVDYKLADGTTPLRCYPWGPSRAALLECARTTQPHRCHGIKMRYENPATGGFPMATIGTFLQMLPAKFSGAPYRSTDATIYCVKEGRGKSKVGDQVFTWGPRDIFVVPSWTPVAHEASEQAILFSASDRPVQQVLRLWREEELG